MDTSREKILDAFVYLLTHPDLWWRVVTHWIIRYVAAWVIAAGVAGIALNYSWNVFKNDRRSDHNEGHMFIDFGGQYLMGRMLLDGHGRQLYNRNYQRVVLQEAYPTEHEIPPETRDEKEKSTHDAEDLMGALMGHDDRDAQVSMVVPLAAGNTFEAVAIAACGQLPDDPDSESKPRWDPDRLVKAAKATGGALYPPINAFVYFPLALFPTLWAYHLNQVFGVLLAFVAGAGIRYLTQGRIWCPVAAASIIGFPGFMGSLNLGQNAALTLAIVIWGWTLIVRGRPTLGAMLWGLLAFKPVWALAFFLVPVLSRRWRVCIVMVLSGAALALLTLPVVGVQTWFDWLKVGHEAAVLYKSDTNWIQLSRDVLSIPRKWFDFDHMEWEQRRDSFQANLVGWAILIAGLEITVRLAILRKEQVRAATGPGPALLFLAAWMSCFHFMYYDVLLGSLPLFLLVAEPRRFLEPRLLAILPLSRLQIGPALADYYKPGLPQDYPPDVPLLRAGYRNLWVFNSMVLTLLPAFLLVPVYFALRDPPWDTFGLMFFWLWCAWLLVRKPDSPPVTQSADQPASVDQPILPADAVQLVQLQADIGSAH